MDIKDIIKNIDLKVFGNLKNEVNMIVNNSRNATSDSIFVALDGTSFKGIDFISDAINRGAKVFLLDEKYESMIINEYGKDCDYTFLFSKLPRRDMAFIARNLYNSPSKEVILIGVTGTKGKSSTCQILYDALLNDNENVALIGTLGKFYNGKTYAEGGRTTLESFETNEFMRNVVDEGCKYFIMEVSSQAMIMERVVGLEFDFTAFTNFSKDHISKNEHPTIEDYFKAKIDATNLAKNVILNIDDPNVMKALDLLKDKNFTIYTKNILSDEKVQEFFKNRDIKNILWNSGKEKLGELNKYNISIANSDIKEVVCTTNLKGEYNLENILCALSILENINKINKNTINSLKNIMIKGRLEKIDNPKNLNIYIDFAHNELSMEKVLSVLRKETKGKLYAVWGPDGGRDKLKRKPMTEIAEKYTDLSINTHGEMYFSETLDEVFSDMKKGIKDQKKHIFFYDRKEAIEYGLSLLQKDDALVLLGLGHETEIGYGTGTMHFDEREIIRKYFEGKE